MKSSFSLAALLCSSLLLQACAGMVAGGAATGASVYNDRRTAGVMLDDQAIELKALKAFLEDPGLSEHAHLNATSFNHVVLLSGEAPTEELRHRAEQLVSGIPPVRRVYNELSLAAPSSLTTRGSDTLITTKVKSVLLTADDLKTLDAARIKVVTENGTVFLMGLVRRAEADVVVSHTSRVAGVQRVVKLFEYVD